MKKAVFGLATSEEHANRIVDHLLSSTFTNEDISILAPDRSKATDRGDFSDKTKIHHKGNLATEKHTKAPEGGVTGATTGGILGGTLGLLAGIGALAIPGVGPFIAAGPLLAALSGSAIGGSLGLLIGSIVGMGIPEYEAKKYESGLKAGNILISVHTDSDEEMKQAKDIMKKEGAKDISCSSETAKSY